MNDTDLFLISFFITIFGSFLWGFMEGKNYKKK